MAKNELNEDLLAGGSIEAGDKKASKEAKKAEKKAEKLRKLNEKNNAKRAEIKEKIDELKAKKAEETDEAKIDALNSEIKALSNKYAAVGSTSGKGVSKRAEKIIKIAVCAVVVVALLVTYVCTGGVRKGFVAYTGLPAKTLTAITIKNGDEKYNVKVDTYNFYYSTQYNNISSQQKTYQQYGLSLDQVGLDVDLTLPLADQEYTDKETNKTITWAEHMQDLTVQAIEQTYTYYLEAVKQNDGKDPEITEDQQKELDETLESYTEQANKSGFTLSGYLTAAMGKGVNEKVFVREVTRQFIAQNYQSELTSADNREYSKEDISKYKKEHLDDLTTVDIKIFECQSEDDAKAFKKALKADGSNFAALCAKYSESKFDKTIYTVEGHSTIIGATKSTLQSGGYAIGTAEEHEHKEGEEEEHHYPGLDWLFSKSRKAGDVRQDSTTVVYVIAPASISDRKTIDVRHILIQPDEESSDQSAVSTEKWDDAYKKAKKILNEWKKGDKTEDSFAELAKKNSVDGSKDKGGLYENVVTGQMVNSFSAWCFDSSRKSGDTDIVKTQYGYHIMYFVENNDETVVDYSVRTALANADGSSDAEKLEKDYTASVNWFGSRYFVKDIDY